MPDQRRRPWSPRWLRPIPRDAVLLFGASLLVTGALTALAARATSDLRAARLTMSAQEVQRRINERMATYVSALRQTRGFLVAHGLDQVTRDTFRTYVDAIDLVEDYPGIQGIGYTARLDADEVPAHEAAVHAEGFPHYRVWPDHPRRTWYSIVWLEPFDWRNQRAFGFDMFTEPVRRAAMERARDTGEPAISGPVRLVQETAADAQPGFNVYLPVYGGGGTPASVDERRDDLIGFVYSPFRAHDLLRATFREGPPLDVDFAVCDGHRCDEESLLFTTSPDLPLHDGERASVRLPLDVSGRAWTLLVDRHADSVRAPADSLPVAIAGVCLLFALLATGLRVAHVRADQALRVRDGFLSIASHELKTPLSTLKLQLELLRRRLPPDAEAAQAAVALIARSADRLTALVTQLLDTSRMMSDRMELRLETVDLGALVRGVVADFDDEARRAGVALTLEVPDSLQATCDRHRVEQIVSNLVTNAVKYGGGTPVVVALARDGDEAVLTVSDQGPGIPPEDHERIFERFERVGARYDGSGLGLGLHIVAMFAQAHGGSVEVESSLGHGAAFRVRLPLAGPTA